MLLGAGMVKRTVAAWQVIVFNAILVNPGSDGRE
jgi:hypothetical protein